jgi:antitoxin (DNA-binding transcriptional repressor) of toxin-antitoxin stability system
MGIQTIEVQESTANLKELLSLVRKGNEVILMEGDHPLARLAPVPAHRRMSDLHARPGTAWISDDLDESLPEEFWPSTDID